MKKESIHSISLKTLLDSDIDRFTLHRDLSASLSPEFLLSIKRYGLLHAPIVMREQEGYQLVCGNRRIRALQAINRDRDVLCRMIAPAETVELLAIIVAEQRLSGPLCAIMTARFVKLFDSLVPQPARHEVMEQLNIAPYRKLQRFLPLLGLEQPLRDAIHRQAVSEKTGLTLCSMVPEDRIFLCDLFLALGLNRNKQKQLIDMCQVITARQGGTIKNLFHEGFREFLPENLPVNRPQAAAGLMKSLYEASHPLSSKAEKQFHERQKGLGLPANCSLSHSPSFEKDQVTLSITFNHFNEMSSLWEIIKNHLEQDPISM